MTRGTVATDETNPSSPSSLSCPLLLTPTLLHSSVPQVDHLRRQSRRSMTGDGSFSSGPSLCRNSFSWVHHLCRQLCSDDGIQYRYTQGCRERGRARSRSKKLVIFPRFTPGMALQDILCNVSLTEQAKLRAPQKPHKQPKQMDPSQCTPSSVRRFSVQRTPLRERAPCKGKC